MNSHEKNETSPKKCQNVLSETDDAMSVSSQSPIFEKEVQPRRSSFSKRRSLTLENFANGMKTVNEKNDKCNMEKIQENLAAEERLQKLKSEKKAWKVMYEERKQKYKEMMEKSSAPSQLELDWNNANFLRDEDKELIKNRPNYEEIISKLKETSEMTAICMHMREKSVHMSRKVMELVEHRETAIQKKIIAHFQSLYSSD